MPDRPQSISLAFVAGETLAAAHFLRAVSAHLMALGRTLELPSEDLQDVLFESDAEQAFAAYPALDLFADLDVFAKGELRQIADALEAAAVKHLEG